MIYYFGNGIISRMYVFVYIPNLLFPIYISYASYIHTLESLVDWKKIINLFFCVKETENI